MNRTFTSTSEDQTRQAGAQLARAVYGGEQRIFIRLKGELGAGKSTFARGFITAWGELSGEPITESIVSPTYNIVKTYGAKQPLAHLDLYRIKTISELEEIGFEYYFNEFSACVVEWLEQVPEALSYLPTQSVEIEFLMSTDNARTIKMKSLKEISLKP